MSEHVTKAVVERLERRRRDVERVTVCVEEAEQTLKLYLDSLGVAKAEVAALESWIKAGRDE
jgi:hypothetical protein